MAYDINIISTEREFRVTDNERPVLITAQPVPGPRGASGASGPAGPEGPPGPSYEGVAWWYGEGPPGAIVGAKPGDYYFNSSSGEIFVLGG